MWSYYCRFVELYYPNHKERNLKYSYTSINRIILYLNLYLVFKHKAHNKSTENNK